MTDDFDMSPIKGKPIIWVMGGPGSGKGTQCERILMKYDFYHLSTGELLRAEVMSGSERGLQLYQIMAAGERVPNDIVIKVLAEAMLQKKDVSGFLVDGYPLDQEQADAFVARIGVPTAIIMLEVNDTILKERLIKRNNFDDNVDSIKKRIDNFNHNTRPILGQFDTKIVFADKSPDDIFAEVNNIMNNKPILAQRRVK